jgi:putative MATE family efflux protein
MFASQFYGARDKENLKRCLGLSLVLVISNAMFWILMATFFGRWILSFYMNDPVIVENGLKYLNISRWSLLFGAVSFAFSNMYRSTQQPGIALRISVFSGLCNVLFNWLLIYGIWIFPEMGVRGAALGTVLAQIISASTLISHSLLTKQEFMGTPAELFSLNRRFVSPIIRRILPLIVNESTFGIGQTLFIKAFGVLGKNQMDAYYAGNQIFNLMTFVIYGYGSSVQILLGSELGRGEIEQARKECDYHIGLATVLSACLVTVLLLFAGPMVSLFRLEPEIARLAVLIVYVFAVKASMRLYNFMIFCILRAGGDSRVIALLDSGLEWLVGLPCAFFCVHVLHMESIALVLLITQLEQLVRLIFGMKRIRSYRWARDLTKLVAD